MKRTLRAFVELALQLVGMALLVFVPAGTVHYWQGWVLVACYTVAEGVVMFDLVTRDRALLARRQQGSQFGEKRLAQKIIILVASAGFLGLLILPGLDHRFGWSHMPPFAAIVGDVLVVLGRAGILAVYRANTFTSATIEVAADQRVISTGPYAIVRHPLYAAGLVMLLGVPIALGSWWGILIVAAMLVALMWRVVDEEKFLADSLQGYRDYQHKVRYRLFPGVW